MDYSRPTPPGVIAGARRGPFKPVQGHPQSRSWARQRSRSVSFSESTPAERPSKRAGSPRLNFADPCDDGHASESPRRIPIQPTQDQE
eukprot:8372230-Pyramimonas_sp.AAC.1